MDWETFLDAHAGVLSVGLSLLALAVALAPLAVAAFVHQRQRRAELRFKRFELYHDLIRRLVEPDQPGAEMRLSRQMAVVFELRSFPEYAEITNRILLGLLTTWTPEKPHLTPLRVELRNTIQRLNKELKREDQIALPPSG